MDRSSRANGCSTSPPNGCFSVKIWWRTARPLLDCGRRKCPFVHAVQRLARTPADGGKRNGCFRARRWRERTFVERDRPAAMRPAFGHPTKDRQTPKAVVRSCLLNRNRCVAFGTSPVRESRSNKPVANMPSRSKPQVLGFGTALTSALAKATRPKRGVSLNVGVSMAIEQANSGVNGSSGDDCQSKPECGGKISQSLAKVILPLLESAKFRQMAIRAWVSSNPNGPAASKAEHAFWSNSKDGRVSVGPVFSGTGDKISFYDAITRWSGQNVFTHTHPFLTNEGMISV